MRDLLCHVHSEKLARKLSDKDISGRFCSSVLHRREGFLRFSDSPVSSTKPPQRECFAKFQLAKFWLFLLNFSSAGAANGFYTGYSLFSFPYVKGGPEIPWQGVVGASIGSFCSFSFLFFLF